MKARNETVWKYITAAQDVGRAGAGNLFSKRPGPTFYCHRVVVRTAFTVLFNCLLMRICSGVFASTLATTEMTMRISI